MVSETEQTLDIAMVGYYNTLPFLQGLEKTDAYNLILDIPSKCMDYYDSGQVDVALVPVATLLERSDYKIITDYCIGCIGAVRTVCLFMNGDINKVTKIYLDKDSRTSQLLVKTLCQNSWNIQPDFEECDVRSIKSIELKSNEAVLMIGDKVFKMENSFKHIYDLGIEWEKLTELPFTFAVWIAREDVDQSIINDLNQALSIGVNDIDAVLQQNISLATKIELSEYFKKYIDYHFDDDKKKALSQFFDYASLVKEIKENIRV